MTTPTSKSSWFYGMSFWDAIIYRSSTALLRLFGRTIWRFKAVGVENLPKEEPFLLLPNHVSMMDSFWVGTYIRRAIKSMTSARLLKIPVLGRYLKAIGCFPKMKYTKDKNAMETMNGYYNDGFAIMIFPEGNRSWNGETAQISNGIGRLIKRMGCKVVYSRINTGYLYHPRWAKYPRWVPVELTYDGPYEYDADLSIEEITQDVQSKLDIQLPLSHPKRVWGFRMAHGLPQLLWACPKCFELEGLEVGQKSGNTICCSKCDSQWELNVFHQMTGPITLTIKEALERIEMHFGQPPIFDHDTFQTRGVALESEGAKLFEIPRGQSVGNLITESRIELKENGIFFVMDGEVKWSSLFGELKGISVEFGNHLHFRLDGKLFQLRFVNESSLKWDYFLRMWTLHFEQRQ
jgi:1-acyl-sn-glycerol-3-phosphate acyltransferase